MNNASKRMMVAIDEIEALKAKVKTLEAGIKCVRDLIDSDAELGGFYRNSEGSRWIGLNDGRNQVNWLSDFNEAEKLITEGE